MIDLKKISSFFRGYARFLLKFRVIFLMIFVLLNVISVVGLKKVEMESSWKNFFINGDPVMQATEKFEKIFGNSESAVILVEADDVFQPEILSMMRELGNDFEMNVPYIDKVVSLSEFEFSRGTEEGMEVGNLVPDEIPTDSKEIEKIRSLAMSKKNLVNKLFSEDSHEAWITVRLQEYPEDVLEQTKGKEPQYVVGKAVQDVLSKDKYRTFHLTAAGMPVVAYDKMNFFMKESGKITMISLVVAVLLLILALRSFRGVIVPLITMISSIFFSYGGMGLLGIKIDSMIMTVPLYLALAVSIGYSIHIFNFFKRGMSETGKRKESVIFAVGQTGWPLLFTALTTIGCMLSFNFVDITSIRWIGNASAGLLVAVYFYVMVLTPIFLSFGKDISAEKLSQKGAEIKSDIFFEKIGHKVMEQKKIITLMFIIVAVVFAYGLTKVKVDMEIARTYGLRVPYVKKLFDVAHSKIGSMYSYNLTVEFDESGLAKDPLVLQKFDELEQFVQNLPLTKNTTSILDIIKDMNATLHSGKSEYYEIPDSQNLVSQYLLLYENSGGKDSEYWIDYDYKVLRLSVAVDNFTSHEVKRELRLIKDKTKELFPEGSLGLVGSMVEGAVITDYIAQGQVKSFLIALIVIGIFMVIVFKSVKAGLIGLIPNILPVIVIGGLMGYLGIGLDMMTMTVIPMLMGIAVDDSIHFVNHVKYEIESGKKYDDAIFSTYKTVGRALLMTSLILVFTFATYMNSVANIYIHIGFLVVVGLLLALLADYTLTPILLTWAKPFHKK